MLISLGAASSQYGHSGSMLLSKQVLARYCFGIELDIGSHAPVLLYVSAGVQPPARGCLDFWRPQVCS